jgi:hypothetical protein
MPIGPKGEKRPAAVNARVALVLKEPRDRVAAAPVAWCANNRDRQLADVR